MRCSVRRRHPWRGSAGGTAGRCCCAAATCAPCGISRASPARAPPRRGARVSGLQLTWIRTACCRSMALRPILQYPAPALKVRAAPVENLDGDVARLIEDMAETMYAAPGVGLAAPQVGVSHRVIVLDVHAEDEEPGKRLLKLVNPVIAERDGEITWEEGCLSVPDLTAPIKRARRILVRAWTPEERELEIEAEELLAVALQHEIDHLDGKLFLDRLSRLKRDLYRARRRKLERQGRPASGSARPLLI